MSLLPDLLFPLLFMLGVAGITLYYLTERVRAHVPVDGIFAGVALAATIGSLLMAFLPGESYYLGLKTILPMLSMWLLLPFLSWNILPGLAGETIGSPLRYLMLRFNLQLAQTAGVLFIVGRMFIAAILLALMARMLNRATDDFIPAIAFLFVIGIGASLSSTFAGPRGSLWLGALTTLFLLVGAVLAIAAVLKSNRGGDHLWEVAFQLDRTWLHDPQLQLREAGGLWLIVPAAFVAMLALLLGDETIYQPLRQLSADEYRYRSRGVRPAIILCFVLLSTLVCLQSYVGLGLAAFYFEQPQAARPQWVANVDPLTQLSLTDPATQNRVMINPATGEPWIGIVTRQPVYDPTEGEMLLDWNLREQAVTPANLPNLLQAGRLYHPNLKQPFTSADQVLNEAGDRIDPLKIASFRRGLEGKRGELVMHRRATEELWPHFVNTQTAVGLRGMFMAAILAAAWCVIDGTVQAIASTCALYTTANQLRVHARTLPLMIGVAIMLCAAPVLIWAYFPVELLLVVFAATIVPIAAVVFVGLTSRHTSPSGAGIALLVGCLWTSGLSYLILSYGKRFDAGIWSLHPACAIPFAFLLTMLLGYLTILFSQKKYRRAELAGLVLGSIRLGDLRPEEADVEIEVPEHEPREHPDRWK